MNTDIITVKNIINTNKNIIKAIKIIFKLVKNITITIRKIIATMNNINKSIDLRKQALKSPHGMHFLKTCMYFENLVYLLQILLRNILTCNPDSVQDLKYYGPSYNYGLAYVMTVSNSCKCVY